MPPGYNRTNYDIHVIAFPLCGNWYYWGYTLNGANTMINGQYSANVITHEMGAHHGPEPFRQLDVQRRRRPDQHRQ